MPATDKTVRDTKKMHVVFAITSVILVISTVWMFWKDHDRPWKEYQKEARAIDHMVSQWRLVETQTTDVIQRMGDAQTALGEAKADDQSGADVVEQFIAFLSDVNSLNATDGELELAAALELADVIDIDSIRQAQEEWHKKDGGVNRREAMAFAMSEQVRLLKAAEDKILGKTKFKRAERDEKASQVGIALSSGASSEEQKALKDELEVILTNPDDGLESLELKYEKATHYRRQLASIGNQFQADVRAAQKALDVVEADKNRLNDAIQKDHSALWEGKWLGKAWLELPILDAFNGPLTIENLWSDDLEQDYNFKKVRRFDRCTTCHQMMEKSVPGQATEPGFVSERTIEILSLIHI